MLNKNFSNTELLSAVPTISCASTEELNNNRDTGPVRIETSYINYLGYDVSLVMRNGLRFTVPLVHNHSQRAFIIRDKYYIDPISFPELKRLFSVSSDLKLPDLQALESGLVDKMKISRNNTIVIALDTVIEQASMDRGKGQVYLANKDLVVSNAKLLDAVSHPYSTFTVIEDKYRELTDNSHGASFYIEIIDNEDQLATRFFYLAKTLFEIKPVKDDNRMSGVYFCSITRNVLDEPVVEKTMYTIEESQERLGLYRSREEAITSGDVESARKETIQRLTHEVSMNALAQTNMQNEFKLELERIKAENATLDSKHKEALTLLDSELKRFDRENTALEAEYKKKKLKLEDKYNKEKLRTDSRRLRDNEYYETRSLARKDSSEIIKVVPTVIMGFVAIGALALKFL